MQRNEIQKALDAAIKDVMRYDAKLLEIKCSERAIVHWLANYFMKHIQKTTFIRENPNFLLSRTTRGPKKARDTSLGYTVDVEYNRVGADTAGEGKMIHVRCSQCLHQENCEQRKEEAGHHYAMLDMVFHQRRVNCEGSNIFCLEVKTTSTKQKDYRTFCDWERVNELVRGSMMVSPQYQFGAAVHIYEVDKAKVWFFTRGEDAPKEAYTVTL